MKKSYIKLSEEGEYCPACGECIEGPYWVLDYITFDNKNRMGCESLGLGVYYRKCEAMKKARAEAKKYKVKIKIED